MIRFILGNNSGATFMPVFITAIYHVIAFKAIFWFRNKIDQNASTDSWFQPMLSSPIDNILVEKAKRQMHLRNGENIVKTYKISLGKNVGF